MSDFLKRYARALGIDWKGPPPSASRRARRRPGGDPVSPPPDRAPVGNLRPSDIRSSATAEAGGMVSQALPGLDVTLMVTEPEGDGLWVLDGRAWRNPRADTALRVVLVQGANVLAESELSNGGHFHFEEILTGEWTLEFHLGGDDVVMLKGPAA